MFSPDGTLISASAAPHCGVKRRGKLTERVTERCRVWGGDVAQLAERRTGTPLRQVRFPDAVRDFSPRVNFLRRLSHGIRTFPCATACINICAHDKHPVVHARIQRIVETLNHLARTVGWVARLCRSWLSPGKATRISHGRNSNGTMQSKKY